MDLRRRRLKVLVNVWGEILSMGGKATREKIVEILRQEYSRNRVEPLRGATKPSDLYEKDLVALYIVGLNGLGLEKDLPQEVLEALEEERIFLEAADALLSSKSAEEARERVSKILGSLPDSAALSKIFRVELTRYYYGFKDKDEMGRLVKIIGEAFPDKETFKRLTRYYIAIKVAESIAGGEVRDRATKEALKQALAFEMGSPRAIPDDEYVAKILHTIFGEKPEKYSKILGRRREEKSQ